MLVAKKPETDVAYEKQALYVARVSQVQLGCNIYMYKRYIRHVDLGCSATTSLGWPSTTGLLMGYNLYTCINVTHI